MKITSIITRWLCVMTVAPWIISPVFAVSVYSANYGSGTISLWDTQGPYVSSNFLTGLANPVGVAVDPAGDVYVTLFGGNGTIQKYSSAGAFISEISNLGYLPYSVRFDINSILYVADLNGSLIRRYTTALNTLPNWVTTNGLPTSIQFDGNGNVFVANSGSGDNVEKFALDGTLLATVGSSVNLAEPHDSITDAFGNLYVSSRQNQVVVKYDSAGNLVNSSFVSGFDPYGLLIDDNKLFVAAHNQGQINIYDLNNNGQFISSFAVGSLPTYIAVNPTAFVVPEPSSLLLLGSAGIVLSLRRVRKKPSNNLMEK